MRIPRLAAPIAAAAVLSAAGVLAQTEGIAEFKGVVHTDKDQTIPSGGKVYISKAAVRVEWQTDLSSLQSERKAGSKDTPNNFKMTMIQKLAEPNQAYVLNDERKTYAVQVFDRKDKTPAPDRKWKVEKLGRDTVAGFSCEKALLTADNGNQTEVCVTTELATSTAWLNAWNRREEQATPLKALKDAGISGFPVRWIFREKGSGKISSSIELVKFDRRSVPASLFEIPAGYRKVDSMVETFAMTPEQEKQMREAQEKMREAMKDMTPEQRQQMEEMMKRYAPTPHN